MQSGTESDSVDVGQGRWLGGDADLYNALISASPNAIVATDLTGVVAYASPSAAHIFGFSSHNEMVGEQILDCVAPHDLENAATNLRYILTEGCATHKEFTLLKKTGDAFTAELSGAVIRSPQGISEGMMFIARDITERRRAESILTEEAERRRILFEQSKDGICVLDLEGKLREFNASFARMLGYSREEMYQLHVWEWDGQWTQEELLRKIREIEDEGATFETVHRRKDGSYYDVEISSNRCQWGGRSVSTAFAATSRSASGQRPRYRRPRRPSGPCSMGPFSISA
ncbi:MAG TPA: PAS domain-containing protein [Verrucomicrobiae bacterium]|nr:PAS domain-containing protein [Verrucomicrobiae bacterium]